MSEFCPTCEKSLPLCICAAVAQIDNSIYVLILRHPQEQDQKLGTARIATLQLKNSVLKTGLSWANLSKALGRPAPDPKKWGILYLGTAKTMEHGPLSLNPSPPVRGRGKGGGESPDRERGQVTVINKKGAPADNQNEILKSIEGIILLDGTWAQAKAMWWRNAWMLKCRRLILQPPRVSEYGNLRKEPRRESVSTIEAAAYTLAALTNDNSLPDKILPPFRLLLKKIGGRG